MGDNIILLSLSILPVLLLGSYVYRQDKFEKEPLGMLLKSFFFGCLSVLPAIFMESLLQTNYEIMFGNLLPGMYRGLYTGFVVAGVSEEFCKLILLALAVWRSRYFDEYFDGIVYATFVSLGFAGLENIMYVFAQDDFSISIATGTMRAILAVPAHFLFGVVMGYYFALAKFQPEHRFGNLVKAFIFPMLLHGTYDSLLMVPEAMGLDGTLVSVIFFAVFIYFDIRLWKIGMRRLKGLQQMNQEPSDYYDNSRAYDEDQVNNYNDNNPPNDPFSGFKWDV